MEEHAALMAPYFLPFTSTPIGVVNPCPSLGESSYFVGMDYMTDVKQKITETSFLPVQDPVSSNADTVVHVPSYRGTVTPETIPEPEDTEQPTQSSILVKPDGRKVRRKGQGTNLYGRPYCPGRPLSMIERQQIIELHLSGMKVNAISKTLCISHGCVSKIITRYRATGVLSPASSPEQRRSRRARKTQEQQDFSQHDQSPGSSGMVPQVIPQPHSHGVFEYKDYLPEYIPPGGCDYAAAAMQLHYVAASSGMQPVQALGAGPGVMTTAPHDLMASQMYHYSLLQPESALPMMMHEYQPHLLL